jgi:tripartite-type tricarboxylate transporter receptor subunit TctC
MDTLNAAMPAITLGALFSRQSRIASAATACALGAAGVCAQEVYPAKPIQVVLPLQAGSASDIAARVVAEKMAEILGQPLVVENVAGVGGLIGTNRVATARADG